MLVFAPLARDTTSINKDQPQSVLELAYVLQDRYRQQVQKSLLSASTPPDDQRLRDITASMGIAIAHHYTSLSYVLRSASEAEHAAKHHYRKDALVVSILRRSGEQTQVGCHWHYPELETEGQPISLFSQFLTLFKNDVLSPKCVYVLLKEVAALVDMEKDAQAAQTSEVKRVLLRHLNLEQKNDKEKEELKERIRTLSMRIVRLAMAMDADEDTNQEETDEMQKESLALELHSTRRRYGIVEVMGWLLAMAFLARKDQELE